MKRGEWRCESTTKSYSFGVKAHRCSRRAGWFYERGNYCSQHLQVVKRLQLEAAKVK